MQSYRIAVGPQAGRKVFTLQTLSACDSENQFGDTVGKVAGFSLHAGVAARAEPIHQSTGGVKKAAVAHAERQRALPAQDAIS
jgi:hypothetical protein